MNISEIAAIILPGLEGSVCLTLSNNQLLSLIKGVLDEKANKISSAMSRDGYLELGVTLPFVGEKHICFIIDSVIVDSNRMIVKLKCLKAASIVLKFVLALLGKHSSERRMENDYLILDLSSKWNDCIKALPTEALDKLDNIMINVKLNDNSAIIHAKMP